MRLFFLLFLAVSPAWLVGQQFGGNPPSLKWKQINNNVSRVIFPTGLEGQAKRVADITDYLHKKTGYTLGTETRKIDIVLQNQTVISNGYVGLAPWRSEFFLTPLQNSLRLGSLPWGDKLAIHEYRHVQQYMNFRKGLSKFAWYVAGEEGQVLANNAAVPDWFFEGDAVFQETIVTEQGRGRLPSFFSEYRSLWEANRSYSYMKLRNGSLRHQVPDHYILGYMLVAYGRKKYGDEFWKKVTSDAVRFNPLFYPFQGAFKRHAGEKFQGFVNEALEFYRSDSRYRESPQATPLTQTASSYVRDYAFPYPLGGDSILVYRRTDRHIPGFYLLHDGTEKKISVKDISIDQQFGYRNGTIVYAAYDPDLRWGFRNFSNIVLLDIRSGSRRQLTSRSKYFSPDLSHAGRQIAAVEVETSGRSSIHILDASTGKSTRLADDSSLFYTYPRFSSDDASIFTPVRDQEGRMTLMKVDLANGKAVPLIPFTMQAISFPYVQGDSIYFTATREGQDKLMAWDDKNGKLHEVMSRYTGVQQGVPRGDEMIFSSPTAFGSMIFKGKGEWAEVQPNEWKDVENAMYVDSLLAEETDKRIAGAPAGDWTVTSYKGTSKFFNFHSWRPYYEQPDWSFTLYGNNILNTFRSSLYYLFNENEKYHQFGFNGSYAAFFPWITGGMSYTIDRNFTDTSGSIYWNELNANIGLRVPLNLTEGRVYSSLSLQSLFNTQRLYFQDLPKSDDGTINYLDNFLSWSFQIQQARQHIYPRLGQTLTVRYRESISEIDARQLLLSTSLYLPGIFRNHNLVLSGAYQLRDTANQYIFSNSFPLSRGYPDLNFPRMWKYGINYHFPIAYPDWGFANIVYFLRLRGNVFYDRSYMKSLRSGTTTPLSSFGMELFFDTRWWNQQEVSFGIRYSRLLDADLFINQPNPNQFEFVLPVNLIPR